jgi:hypothetical protein
MAIFIMWMHAAIVITNPKRQTALINRDFSEIGNAERLVDLFGDVIRFVSPCAWYIKTDGRHWQRDRDRGIRRLVILTLKETHKDALALANEIRRGDYGRFPPDPPNYYWDRESVALVNNVEFYGAKANAETYLEFAEFSQSAKMVRAMVSLAANDVQFRTADFIDDPMLVGTLKAAGKRTRTKVTA